MTGPTSAPPAPPAATLVITRGLPASGKTTWARAWVEQGREHRVRVNRDDLRANLFGAYRLDHAGEETVTAAQRAAVAALLRRGRSVVVDDTHLRARFARLWADLARELGVGFEVRDFLDVDVEECVRRDDARAAAGGRAVGAEAIRGLHATFLSGGRRLPPVQPTPAAPAPAGSGPRAYEPPEPGTLPPAWLVDIDGTLAIMGSRSPYAWDRVGEDEPNAPVAELALALRTRARVLLVSGRDESCRALTRDWLERHGIGWDELFMRPEGDTRKDSIVKAELFDRHVRGRYDVRGVVDDRRQVVEMWRAMGLTVAQVAPGDF